MSHKLSSISLVSWALNEEENVVDFMVKAHEFCSSIALDYEIVIVDDGSTDRTLSLLNQYSQQDQRLRYFSNAQNLGVGLSMKKALSLASSEYLIWQTQDWSYELDGFRKIIQTNSMDNKIVHGVRSLNSSLSNRSDNKLKAIISICNYWLIRVLFRAPFSDFQNVTLYPKAVYDNFQLVTASSFTSPELLLRTWSDGSDFIEIPVDFIPRKFGIAKGTKPSSILKSVREIVWFRLFHWPAIHRKSYGVGRITKSYSKEA